MTTAPTSPTPGSAPQAPPPDSRRSGMAITALVLGILGLALYPICGIPTFALGVVGLILGIIATVRANRQPAVYGGKGLAIAGICLGSVALVLAPVTLSILLPRLSRARELVKRAVDSAHLRAVSQACIGYAMDENQFPPNFAVLLDGGLISAEQLQNPADPDHSNTCDYYYVSYPQYDKVDELYRSPRAWPIAFSDPKYHDGEGAMIAFIDGFTDFVEEPEFSQLLENFKRKYEVEFGEPPVILPPH